MKAPEGSREEFLRLPELGPLEVLIGQGQGILYGVSDGQLLGRFPDVAIVTWLGGGCVCARRSYGASFG